jgi:hypothetical protein
LACPLMHLFMHHGDGDHDHDGDRSGSSGSGAAPGPGSTARRGPASTESGGSAHYHH